MAMQLLAPTPNGVNAYIEEVKNQPEKLPVEFTLLRHSTRILDASRRYF